MNAFLGHYPDRVIDPSRRLLLPIEWRTKGAPTEFTLLLWPLDVPEYVLAIPRERWTAYWNKLEELPLSDDESAELERLVSLRAFPSSLDKVGRLAIPEAATKAVNIENTAHMIGRVTKFEICRSEKVSALLDSPDTKRLSQTLKQIRI